MKSLTITDWMQALTGFASLILTIIVWQQGNRVKTLTDVVDQLATQTTVLTDQYKLQLQLTEPQRMPVFRTRSGHVWNAGGPEFHVTLLNVGTPAFDVKFTPITDGLSVGDIGPDKFYTHETYNMWELLINAPEPDFFNFSFKIEWRTVNGDRYDQVLKCEGLELSLLEPHQIK